MTAQLPDIIELDGESQALCSNPLEQFFELHPPRPDLPAPSTACWRGYVARWRIENNQLFLVSIHSGLPDDDLPPRGHPIFTVLLRHLASGDAPPSTPIGLTMPLMADWFSGELRIPQGQMLEYHHAGYASVYEAERVILVQKGVITGDTVERLPEEVLAEHRAQQERWRIEQEQDAIRAAQYQERRQRLAESLTERWPEDCSVGPALLIGLYSETTMLGFIETLFEDEEDLDRLACDGGDLVERAGDLAMDLADEPPDHMPEARAAYAQLVRAVAARRGADEDDEDDEDEEYERQEWLEETLKSDMLALLTECRRILSHTTGSRELAEHVRAESSNESSRSSSTTPQIIQHAAAAGETIRITYINAQGDPSTRNVDVQWCDADYFSGYCHLREEARTFRVDRVRSARCVGRHQRPKLAEPDNRDYFSLRRDTGTRSLANAGKQGCAPMIAIAAGVVCAVSLLVVVIW